MAPRKLSRHERSGDEPKTGEVERAEVEQMAAESVGILVRWQARVTDPPDQLGPNHGHGHSSVADTP